jgi:DNA-binding transcriptional MerR regulator
MEGGFRLYSEDDVARVEQIKRLQTLLGLTLAEIKDMVEAEEVREELRASYRPDLDVESHIDRLRKLMEVTKRQREIVSSKMAAMLEMKNDLDEKLKRQEARLSEFEKERDRLAASPGS